MTSFEQPVRLTPQHQTTHFKCGHAILDEWLTKYAIGNQTGGMTVVYVSTAADSGKVAGFYALSTGGVQHQDAPGRITKGIGRFPVPVIILTRMAVHEDFQGEGLGRGLLRDALIRVANAADTVGVRALLIHAKDDAARDFYVSQVPEFEPSPVDPRQLMLLLKDLRAALETAPEASPEATIDDALSGDASGG